MNNDVFLSYHPVVNFVYFCIVILFGMIFMHPWCLAISLTASVSYAVFSVGKKQIMFNFKYMLPLMLVTALLNPIFNHSGVTIITYLPDGNPLSAESIIYGAAAAVMLASSVNWFSCFGNVMTTDKITYISGRIIPTLSLVFSMSVRFVPRFTAQARKVIKARKCMGIGSGESLGKKLKNTMSVMSIMVTWSLENSAETADSMKSRGYGLKGRTSFSIFSFDGRDLAALSCIMCISCVIIVFAAKGKLDFGYTPVLYAVHGADTVGIIILYAALTFMPCILNVLEKIRWKKLLNSKM